jgi:hypothetical protein
MRTFYVVQIGSTGVDFAVNVAHLRAIVPLGGNRFHIWLSGDLDIPARVGNRLSKLAGVTPLSKDGWEVASNELGEIFDPG